MQFVAQAAAGPVGPVGRTGECRPLRIIAGTSLGGPLIGTPMPPTRSSLAQKLPKLLGIRPLMAGQPALRLGVTPPEIRYF